MKNNLPIFIIILFISFKAYPQFLKPEFGGEYIPNKECYCLTEEERLKILNENDKVIQKLISEGKLTFQKTQVVKFQWPLRMADNLNDYGYYGISNFVDHNPVYQQIQDYNNGTRSYDLVNYNHMGTDIFTWPFGWYKMDNSQVEIVAAADGIIIAKFDGNDDRSCGLNGGQWNAVYLSHSDGSKSWYGHMKKNSLTTKNIGETVTAGEYLGVVGSSGNSTGPHLHFEVYDSQNNLIDPWVGPGNPTTGSSWWEEQKSYFDPKINKVATHSNWPEFPPCPQQEILNLKNNFSSGDTIFFVTYYQDQLKGMNSSYAVVNPENITIAQWNHSINDSFYVASYWGWSMIIPQGASAGNWKFSVVFNGLEYSHTFQVNMPTNVEHSDNLTEEYYLSNNYPNPFNPSTKINYRIPKYDLVTIKLYNILGNEIKILENDYKAAGKYELEIDGSNLNSGVYFLNFNSGSFNKTAKLILIK